jgi:hypothetical protein
MRTNSIFIAHVAEAIGSRSAADGLGVADFPGFTPWPRCGTRTGHGLGNSHRRSPEGQVSRWPTPGCGR